MKIGYVTIREKTIQFVNSVDNVQWGKELNRTFDSAKSVLNTAGKHLVLADLTTPVFSLIIGRIVRRRLGRMQRSFAVRMRGRRAQSTEVHLPTSTLM